ncbi:UDP-N-acetylmuramate dehydrogenase [Lachnospiraceae bacterium ZAX-1]
MKVEFAKEINRILAKNQIYRNEPMNRHTTFRIGGPADLYVCPKIDQIAEVLKLCKFYQVPFHVIGNGSNLLVGDKGVRGLVIEIGKMAEGVVIEHLDREQAIITVQAGTLLSKTANTVSEAGLSGMEFACGIPGTVGGAIAMNAGAYGGEMKNIVHTVLALTPEGDTKTLAVGDMDFSYRHSVIASHGYIVLEVALLLQKENPELIAHQIECLKKQRSAKQPLEYPSAGSTFKRPPGFFAGQLIMEAGLSGYQVGGAQVAEKHCGFVINRGKATAADICHLIEEVKNEVLLRSGVALETEIKFLGEF